MEDLFIVGKMKTEKETYTEFLTEWFEKHYDDGMLKDKEEKMKQKKT